MRYYYTAADTGPSSSNTSNLRESQFKKPGQNLRFGCQTKRRTIQPATASHPWFRTKCHIHMRVSYSAFTVSNLVHSMKCENIALSIGFVSSFSIGVRSTTAAECSYHINKSAIVLHSTLGPTSLLLFLFLLLHFGSLSSNFAGTS